MADVDFDAMAAKYGGADAKKPDYDALASKYGAATTRTRLDAVDAALQRGTIGVGETIGNLATSAVAAPVAGLAGIAQGVKNLVGADGMPAADRVRQVQDALTFQPRSDTGKAITGAVAYPFEKLAEGADVAGEAAANATNSPAFGAAVNTGIQSIPAVLGKTVAPMARRTAALARERADVLSKVNQPAADAILAAQERGLTISPAEANPSLLNRVLEGASGQAKVQQLASTKNQPIVQNIVRKALGIREDSPVTVEALESVRKEAGKTYEKVRKVGEIPLDDQYTKALDVIERDYKGAAKSFSEEVDPVQKAVDSARNTTKEGAFDSDAAVSKIKLERRRGDKAFRQGDAELGKAHKAIADAIEQQISRKLQSEGTSAVGGRAGLLDEFEKSREIIAKSYDVQKSLKNGEIDARVLAEQLRKGKKITGELAAVAKIAGKFPGSFQAGGRNAYTTTSAFDLLAGGGAGAGMLFHGPAELAPAAAAALAATAARPAIRAGITSGPYQRNFANPPTYGSMTPELARILSSDHAVAAAAGLQPHGFRTLEDELGNR